MILPYKNPEDAKKYQKEYRKKNSEKSKEESSKWRKENPEKSRVGKAKWRKENPEKHREHTRRSREKYPEKERERQLKYFRNNREKIRELTKRWKKENPESVQAHRRKYNRKHPRAETLVMTKYRRSHRECEWSDCNSTRSLHVHHVLPKYKYPEYLDGNYHGRTDNNFICYCPFHHFTYHFVYANKRNNKKHENATFMLWGKVKQFADVSKIPIEDYETKLAEMVESKIILD